MVLHYRKRGDVWHCRGSVRSGRRKLQCGSSRPAAPARPKRRRSARKECQSAMRGSVTPGGATSGCWMPAQGVARREFDIIAAWSVCRLGRSLSDLNWFAGRATIPRHRPLPAPAGARHLDAIGQDVVRHVGRVHVVRASDDPRSGAGGTGSRSIIRQAPGQAEDDAVQGGAYPSALDEGRGVRETARLLKVSPPRSARSGACRRPRTTLIQSRSPISRGTKTPIKR